MKILVMGGSYFVGRKIVEILAENDYEVFVLNRGSKTIDIDNISQIMCDRYNEEELEKVLMDYNFDTVIDVSGLSKESSVKLINALNLEHIKNFIFISSSAVYDADKLEIPYKETDILGKNKYWNEYGTNKIEAEQYYTNVFEGTNTKLSILRPPYMYGENNYVQRESFIFDHLCKENPILIPKSNIKIQFLYTTDLAKIILSLIINQKNNIEIFNVGNREGVTIREWIEACAKVANKKAEIIEYDYEAHNRGVRDFFPFQDYDDVLDVSKINKLISDETSFEEGLTKAYHWYIQNKQTIKFKENVSKNEIEILKEINR